MSLPPSWKAPSNLGRLMEGPARTTPDRPAIHQGGQVLTYRELDERCDRVAAGLDALGIQPGERVALLYGNEPGFLETFFGTMRLGAVAVPLNTRLPEETLQYILRDSAAVALAASGSMDERARALADAVPGLKVVAPASWLAQATAAPRSYGEDTDPEAICFQPYTSGSTGKPKGVLLTHGGQVWNADVMRQATMLGADDVGLVAVPLYHKNAMIGAVKPLLLAGGSLVILPDFEPGRVIETIERFRVTYLTGVPIMFRRLLAELEKQTARDVGSVRYGVCGSAEVGTDLIEHWQRLFRCPIADSYGLTEGGPVPLANTRTGLKKPGSCGRPVPGSEVRLTAPDGTTPVGADEVGELVVRNPGIARGYWKLPELTARRFQGGWLRTGDLFRRDPDGYFYFVGRADDMMNVGGENVYPKEVEDVLCRHPEVREAYVVSRPHPLKGEVPVAFVVARDRDRCSEAELKSFFLGRGAAYAHPRQIAFLDAVPLTGTGKPDRQELRRRARELPDPAGRDR